MDNSVSNKEIWNLIDLLFNTKNVLYNMHYLSYQQFIEDNIISELNKKYVIHENIIGKQMYRYSLKFDNIMLKAPSDEFDYDTISPNDARIRHINYSSKLIVDIKQIQEIINFESNTIDEKILYHEKKINIGAIPIMVRSKYCTTNIKKDIPNLECPYDPGCYFIIKGLEKVVVSHERICENKELIFPKKDTTFPDGVMYSVQVNSKAPDSTNINITSIKMLKDKTILLTMPHFSEIPVFIIFRVLGFESDEQIINHIVYDNTDTNMINMIKPSLTNSSKETYKDDNGEDHKIITKEDAENYLIQKMKTSRKYNETDSEIRHMQKKEHLLSILENELFSHMEKGMTEKGYYLGMMCNKLLQCILKRIEPDDRDNFINKRIDLPGALMTRLFEQYLKKMINECSKNFKKRMGGLTTDVNPSNIIGLIKSMTIEQGFTTALATGNWGSNKKKGVAQPLHRHNYLNTISYFRRIITPSPDAAASKMDKMRHIHSGQYGFIDPVESPDGEKIGIQKHLALSASVTINSKEQIKIIKDLLDNKPEIFTYLTDVPSFKIKTNTKVFISGQWYGMTDKPIQLVEYLRTMRSKGVIVKMVGIAHNYKTKEIRINTDGGRLYRPLLKVKNNKLLLTNEMLNEIDMNINSKKISTWNDFISKYNDAIEYVDCEESENLMIAMTTDILNEERNKMLNKVITDKNSNNNTINRYSNVYRKFTHCELNPAMMLGSVSSNIPFSEHNQSPRNIYNFSQARQAMGLHVSSLRNRIDLTYQLFHPQIPLVHTRMAKYTNMLNLPSGENVIVAIACYTGYNQEDSIIINRSSVDRGLLRASYFTKYHDVIQKNPSTSRDDIFMKPDPNQTMGIQYGNYDKLNDKGYIEEETRVDPGDFIIGKVSQIQPDKNNSNKIYKDSSTKYKSGVAGVIDKVYTGVYNTDNFEMYNVKVRSERIPRVGDKLCMLSDHEVLTNKGWIKFDELYQRYHNKEDFKIATLHDGQNIKYDTPIDVYEWDYEGDMYKLTSEQAEFCVTMDHEILAKKRNLNKFKLIKAKDLIGKRYNLKKNGIIDIPDVETININGKIFKMDDLLHFLGIFITNGYLLENNIYITNIKTIHTYNKMDLEHDICDSEYIIKSTKLYKWLEGYNKNIPDFVFELNSRQARILLSSLLLFSKTQDIYTSTNKLANDVMKLAIHAGWSATIKQDEMLCVSINKYKNEPHINNNTRQHEEIVYHKGKVYCLQVPSHIFMIRYNNKNVWTGNCSRHAQKGSVGISLPTEDMPFTKDGIQPDIIINPNAIPSRMTIGQLFECVLGKASVLSGHLSDATPFENVDIEEAKKVLKQHGFEEHGNETLYCGFTGKKMESQIFIGPTYYFRLKHMVLDKIHCLTAEHDVLTTEGWVPINEVKENHKVATLDNNKLVYVNPIEVHHYPDYKGKMYRVKNQEIELEVTANHRMYIKINDDYILEKAENIVGKKVAYKNHENKDIIVNDGIIEDELYDYEGAVYCLTVPSEIFMVRKNGKSVWTGNSRSRGPTAILTRQPTEGRAREGGLRFGEMERDAMISHGLSQFLKERFMETSDQYFVHVCDNCGLFARKVIDSNHYICDSCRETKKISTVALPYAFKLMVQELLAINIMPRIKAS
jgi:DNA-directed RNA polymerase II subunit RPB2